MKENFTDKIEAIIASGKIQVPEPSPDLYSKIQHSMLQTKHPAKVVPMRNVLSWSIAASLLLIMNIYVFVFYNNKSESKATEVAYYQELNNTYFYSDSLNLAVNLYNK